MTYRAPWGRLLWITSAFVTVLVLGVAWTLSLQEGGPGWAFLCVAGAFVAALFVVRSYRIIEGELQIQRLLWFTRIPLADLEEATVDPDAMKGSLRTWGNGGFYSFTGWYHNGRLGHYRAFVNDPGRSVILRFTSRRIVLSPDRPEAFVEDIQRQIKETGDSSGAAS